MPLLELRRVEARYGALTALHGINLTVGEGEVVAVLGANGAGKTTTLRTISGTVKARGDVVFAGKRLAPGRPESTARLGIAHVPEGRGTFADLTVRENLRLGAYEPSLGLAPLVVAEIFRIVGEVNEQEGVAVLVVEQNAMLALDRSSRAYVLEVGRVAVAGTSEELRRHESVRRSYLGY
jgi:branched-chain amino acid transport system ATP-binding protein